MCRGWELIVANPDSADETGEQRTWTCFLLERPKLQQQNRPLPVLSPLPEHRLVIALPKTHIGSSNQGGAGSASFQPNARPSYSFSAMPSLQHQTSRHTRYGDMRRAPNSLWAPNSQPFYLTETRSNGRPAGIGWSSDFHAAKKRNADDWARIFQGLPLGNIRIVVTYDPSGGTT